jgi:hypothetical protein
MSIRESKWRQITKITIIKPKFWFCSCEQQIGRLWCSFYSGSKTTAHTDNIIFGVENISLIALTKSSCEESKNIKFKRFFLATIRFSLKGRPILPDMILFCFSNLT